MKTINDIPCGHLKPLPRPANPLEDRILRKQIETANTKDDCIINVGNGYYKPVPGDPVDEKELDALVNCGVLKNDGWDQISGFTDTFCVDKEHPRIEVTITELTPKQTKKSRDLLKNLETG